MDTFDLVIIGAGPGGYVAAIRAGQLGIKTALIEKRDALGGTCLNVGCIPSKALLEASHHFYAAKHLYKGMGVICENVHVDLDAMMAHKNTCVTDLTGGIRTLMKKNKVSVYTGTASLVSADTVRIDTVDGDVQVQAKSIVLATGSAPIQVPGLPFDGQFIVSSTEALAFDKIPEHLVVVGGGVIGVELGSVWARLGAKVTVVEMLDRITPFADKMLSQTLERTLKKQGLDIRTKTKVTGARIEGGRVLVDIESDKGKTETLDADKMLVAVGRKPYTDGLNLQGVGVELDERKRVVVDEHFRTNIPGIYAIGDLIDGPMLAHKAEEEGIAVAEIIVGKPGHVNRAAIPNVVYTHPELAMVGMTEDECKEAGHEVAVGKYFYKGNGRAKTMAESDGLVKVVADAKTDRILGVHILGANASELIAEMVAAVEFSASAEDIGRMVHAHPTLSEMIKEASLAVHNEAIHA
jgi:dihydrolipoamide dehydrogenase